MPKPVILCVDDERYVLTTLRDFLEQRLGHIYGIEVAESGEEALELLDELDTLFQEVPLIICDQIMPGIKGDQLLMQIHHRRPKMRKVMLTGLASADAVGRAVNEARLYRYLAKPWDEYDLELTVKEALRSYHQDKELVEVNEKLQELNQGLEKKVLERTQELQEANQKIALLNDQLQEENLRMGAELDVARKLQQMLLPTVLELVNIPDLEIAGLMEPAVEVGGDYYDVLFESDRVTIGVGDVTGHGLESGILAIVVQTAIRTLVEQKNTNLVDFLSIINRVLTKNLRRMGSDRNLSLMLIDYHQSKLKIAGQHEKLILFKSTGEVESIDTFHLGFPIGLIDDITPFLWSMEITLQPGDGIVLYTDGVTEAEDPQRKFYGFDRLCGVVQKYCQSSAQHLCDCILTDIQTYIDTQKVFDDITLLVVKYKGAASLA